MWNSIEQNTHYTINKIKKHTRLIKMSSFSSYCDAACFWVGFNITKVIRRLTFLSVLQEQIYQKNPSFFLWGKSILYWHYAKKLSQRFIEQGRSCSYLLLMKNFSSADCQFGQQNCSRPTRKELRKTLRTSTRCNAAVYIGRNTGWIKH